MILAGLADGGVLKIAETTIYLNQPLRGTLIDNERPTDIFELVGWQHPLTADNVGETKTITLNTGAYMTMSPYAVNGMTYAFYKPNGDMLHSIRVSGAYGWTAYETIPYVGFFISDSTQNKSGICHDSPYSEFRFPHTEYGPAVDNTGFVGSLIGEWITGADPIKYNFKPISYLRSPLNHLKLSMIKEEYTNEGKPVSMVDRDINIERTTPESNIGVLAKNIVIGGRKVVGWTANNKYVAIHRLPNNPEYPSLISFEIEHYIDGQIVSGLTTTITGFSVGDTINLYFSYIIDEEHEAARLSIIRIDHVGGLYTAYYNQETVTAEQYTGYYNWLSGGYMFGEPENPYDWGTPSEESDGDGTHDRTSDTIGEPETPAVGVSDAGFITLYTPTYNQINSLAAYMWSELDLTNLRRLFADPMDCLISLNILPFSIDASGQKEIFVGNIGTGVSANVAASQWKTINMGSIDVAEFFAGYMDYSPYTKIEMYLPYIGIVNLNPDDVMYSTITLKYKVDILTGACVAYLMVDRTGDDQHTAVSAPLYTFTGNCAISIPVTAASYGSVFQSIIGMAATAGTVGAAAITGGMSAPVALGAAATLSTNAMNMKPDVSRSGVMGSTAGFLNQQHAYLIVTRPNQCRASQQEKYTGFPAHIAYTLNTLSGYTEVESVHLEGIPCTESEYTEIENLLKGGVII